MASRELKYCEYFDVNEKYFPCIDESAINNGAAWDDTYPHETFIELLKLTEKMLGGTTNRSIWIHGAYGTGKSRCVYTLKKLMEVPEDEVRTYWKKFEPLKKETALLEKIIGHKQQGIVPVFRYATGSITTARLLFFAVQESIMKSLKLHNMPYKGEKSLKECVIAWLEDPSHNRFMNDLLEKPKWKSVFSQSTSDELINTLKKNNDVLELMDNIFKLAAQEGITAFDLTADSLRDWVLDVIRTNKIKIVFIWDEFNDYFKQNATSLSEFQKIVSISQEAPFYFIIVTHPLSSIVNGYAATDKSNPWSVVQQRFNKVEITLPDNIAFDLIGHAFSVKKAAADKWNEMTNDLYASITSASDAVVETIKTKNCGIMRNILPIHPMAALALKNIASAFQSNQRSMFDFIKTSKDMEDVKAFQWFIQNTSPLSNRPLLTIDMLWNFFYEKNREYLTSDIKLILDTFPQQNSLKENEKIVLKTILIMQAIDQRLSGSIPILKPTDQNLSYAFEGEDELENSCKGIAKSLVSKGVLIENFIGDGKKMYSVAVIAGDNAKIELNKKQIREKLNTSKLVTEGEALATALGLSPALKLRYAIDIESGKLPVVTMSDFKRAMDVLKHKDSKWRFYAVLALASTEDEAQSFRTLIQQTMTNVEYKNITVIDALSSPLGLEALEQYVEYSAMAMYYQSNNNQQSKENARKAKDVLERDWKNRIHDGQFIVFNYANQLGEKAVGANAVQSILQSIVLKRFGHVLDFTKGLSETQLKLTVAKQVSKYGMALNDEVKGLIAGCEKTILGKFWSKKEYWNDESLAPEHIVVMKKAVDKTISDAFKTSGKISFGHIYDYLETNFGLSPCNLNAFIIGFLLKEYNSEPYRYMDADGYRDSMTPDKLSEMIGNYMGKSIPKDTYIVNLTEEEKAFYEFTETAWNILPNTCSAPQQAGGNVRSKMKDLSYPVWCLEDVDTTGVFDLVKLYIKLVQSPGDVAHNIANEIGKIAIQRQHAAQNLKELLTIENCKKGMCLFLDRFENGKLMTLAKEINAEDVVLSDIKALFSVENSALWIDATGEDEIRKLITEYEVIKYTNSLLNMRTHTKEDAFNAWREVLKFIGFSCESIIAKKPTLKQFFDYLLNIVNSADMLPDNMKLFLSEMHVHNAEIRYILNNPVLTFIEIYKPYLDGFSDVECEEIKHSIQNEMFTMSAMNSNATVKTAAEDYKKKQLKTQLYKLWNDYTKSKNPRVWSERYRTPILICIPSVAYAEAKKTFATLNNNAPSETDIKDALLFLKGANFFDEITSEEYRNNCFMEHLLGNYASLLQDISAVRDTLETMGINAYEWNDNPSIKAKLKDMAQAEYNAGGSEKVIKIIEKMDGPELKNWLIDAVKKDMELGVKIIIHEEN